MDRLLSRAALGEAQGDDARRYVRETYCARFEDKGWIYEDGALRIAAHTALDEGRMCATARAGKAPRTLPCDELHSAGERRLDCGLLHHVRRSEVRIYVSQLRGTRVVTCDDGTPRDDLGVP